MDQEYPSGTKDTSIICKIIKLTHQQAWAPTKSQLTPGGQSKCGILIFWQILYCMQVLSIKVITNQMDQEY